MVEASNSPEKCQEKQSVKRKRTPISTRPTVKFPYVYQTAAKRASSLQCPTDFSASDPVLHYMLTNAEELETPKRVISRHDWLHFYKENGQEIRRFLEGAPEINWMNPRSNKLIIFVIDTDFNESLLEKVVAFFQACYAGLHLSVVKAGQTMKKDGKKVTIPENFLEAHEVTVREAPWDPSRHQYLTVDICEALKQYKSRDNFAIVALTSRDIYPRDDSDFLNGIAVPEIGCAVSSTSMHRENTESMAGGDLLFEQLVCHTTVHEMGHLFGLKHCVTYECTMNGSNAPQKETLRNSNFTFCALCLCKLKLNSKLDCRERLTKMLEVTQQFGFATHANKYAQILAAFNL